jgi:peptidoglycan biosynthesis protein MviN/MurJ (putative lipid II flippase)
MAMSVATFAMAAASGVQAVLYLSHFGTNTRTDGFFVAFAVYTTFGVFGQSLRLTSVPLLVGPGAKLSVRQYATALAFLGLPVLLVTGALAGPVSHLLAPGLTVKGRSETAAALPVLGLAMVLQLWAAGGATVLAIRDRFASVASAYIAGSASGLVAFLALLQTAGVQTLGWSMLTMAVVTCAWMLTSVRSSGGFGARSSLAPSVLARHAGMILGTTPVYLVFNMLFVVTLAFASSAAAGDSTVLSYAYLFASYLVAGTGMALGMSRIPEMTRTAPEERHLVVARTVPQGFRYSILIIAPALGALIVAGAPLIHALFPASLKAGQVRVLREFAVLLAPWAVAALLVNLLLPAMFAIRRVKLLTALALPLLLLHVAATAVGHALFGLNGAVGAFFIAPTTFAIILVLAGARESSRRLALQVGKDVVCFAALTTLAFGAGYFVGLPLSSALVASVAAGAVGCGAYAAGLLVVAKPQIAVLRGALNRSAAA